MLVAHVLDVTDDTCATNIAAHVLDATDDTQTKQG